MSSTLSRSEQAKADFRLSSPIDVLGIYTCGEEAVLYRLLFTIRLRWRGWKTSNYLMGMSVCFENHPTLGTEPQNILTEGTYLVMPPVGAVRAKTSKRQFKTSAT